MRILCADDANLIVIRFPARLASTPEPQPPEPGDPVPVGEPGEEEEHEDDPADDPPQEAA